MNLVRKIVYHVQIIAIVQSAFKDMLFKYKITHLFVEENVKILIVSFAKIILFVINALLVALLFKIIKLEIANFVVFLLKDVLLVIQQQFALNVSIIIFLILLITLALHVLMLAKHALLLLNAAHVSQTSILLVIIFVHYVK